MKGLVVAVAALVSFSGCVRKKSESTATVSVRGLPPAPKGTWFTADSEVHDGSLISAATHEKVSAWADGEAWMFACGNEDKYYQTDVEAMRAAVACAEKTVAGVSNGN